MQFIALLTLLISISAFGRDLVCSSSSGELQFSIYQKSGGAAPYPGMLMSKTEWKFNGTTVYLKRTYADCPEWEMSCEQEADPESNLAWDEGPRVILEQEGDTPFYSRTIFGTKMSLYSTDGEVINGMSWKNFESWMICEEIRALYP